MRPPQPLPTAVSEQHQGQIHTLNRQTNHAEHNLHLMTTATRWQWGPQRDVTHRDVVPCGHGEDRAWRKRFLPFPNRRPPRAPQTQAGALFYSCYNKTKSTKIPLTPQKNRSSDETMCQTPKNCSYPCPMNLHKAEVWWVPGSTLCSTQQHHPWSSPTSRSTSPSN